MVDSSPSPVQSLVSAPMPTVKIYNTKPHGLPRRPWVNMSQFLNGILLVAFLHVLFTVSSVLPYKFFYL